VEDRHRELVGLFLLQLLKDTSHLVQDAGDDLLGYFVYFHEFPAALEAANVVVQELCDLVLGLLVVDLARATLMTILD
jgi:hypothetical protein